MVQDTLAKVGSWAFILGVFIALIVGLVSNVIGAATTTSVLIVLGLIVGFLNVTETETKDFLLASVSLVVVTALGGQVLKEVATVGPYLQSVLNGIMTFVIPATILVALKAIYSLAQE